MDYRQWAMGRGAVLIHRGVAGFGRLHGWRAELVRGGLSLTLAAMLLAAGASGVWGQGKDDHPLDKFQTGQITGKSDRGVRINNQDLALHPRVVIHDDEGRPKTLQDIQPNMEVRYLLKGDRVKELILVTPK